jgi:hypothetical protein
MTQRSTDDFAGNGGIVIFVPTVGFGITRDYILRRVHMVEKYMVWPREDPFLKPANASRDWMPVFETAASAFNPNIPRHRHMLLRVEISAAGLKSLHRDYAALLPDHEQWSMRWAALMRLPDEQVRFCIVTLDEQPAVPLDDFGLPAPALERLKEEGLDCVQSLNDALAGVDGAHFAASLESFPGMNVAEAQHRLTEALPALHRA